MGDWRDIFDTPDAHAGSGERTDGCLGARPGAALLALPGCTHPDMDADDPFLAGSLGHVARHLHRRIGRALVPVLLDDHPAAALGHGLRAGEVGYGDDRVVEGREDVGDAPLFLLVCRHVISFLLFPGTRRIRRVPAWGWTRVLQSS